MVEEDVWSCYTLIGREGVVHYSVVGIISCLSDWGSGHLTNSLYYSTRGMLDHPLASSVPTTPPSPPYPPWSLQFTPKISDHASLHSLYCLCSTYNCHYTVTMSLYTIYTNTTGNWPFSLSYPYLIARQGKTQNVITLFRLDTFHVDSTYWTEGKNHKETRFSSTNGKW